MRYPLWKKVDLSTHWRTADGRSLLVISDEKPGEAALVRVSSPQSEPSITAAQRWMGETGVTIGWILLSNPDYVNQLSVEGQQPMGPRLRRIMGPKAVAINIPPIEWIDHSWMMARTKGARILVAGEHRLDHTNILDYTLAQVAGQRPVVTTLEERRTAALERADEIKAEYGELLLDIVYRIDYPALFDPAVATTEAFQVALVQYDTRPNDLSVPDLESLVNGLEITYSVARDNAETLAERHLPEGVRDDARRASKAANLAVNAATDGERVASLAQVKRILDSLALYYLPKIDGETLAIEAG